MATKKKTKRAVKKKAASKKRASPKGKRIRILGKDVPEKALKAAMRDTLKTRGIKGDLILEKPMTAKEKGKLRRNEDFQYANVYKYAFF